jgi:hypothetical protein
VILWRVVVERSTDVDEINALVHDAYADSDLLTFDEARKEVRFPFAQEIDTWVDVSGFSVPRTKVAKRPRWPFARHVIPFFQVNLTIRNVAAMSFGPHDLLADPWSLNEFVYDERSGRLVLDPVIGPELAVDIDKLELEAEITDHVAVTVERRFGLIGESGATLDDLRLHPPV